ncbi:MAG TPA: hypothetical protein VGY31_04135 [Terriglobia bacterium]|nr:hypothetical protein [Terriglobia bacterium]
MDSHPNGVLYCRLMEYIKWRIEAVLRTLTMVKAQQHYLDNRLAAEFCLLQLRVCCELLAIGCIAIHTDVPQTKVLQRMWNADAIMTRFEKLKPEFFPFPVRSEKGEDGTFVQHEVVDALTKSELTKMYNFFGSLLHTGTFELYAKPKVRTYDFSLIEDFVSKLIRLLNDHTYQLHDGKTMVRIIMHNEKDGHVWINVLQRRPI